MSDNNQKPEFKLDPALAEFESMLGECQLGESATDVNEMMFRAGQATVVTVNAKQPGSNTPNFWWPVATVVASVLALGFAAAWLSARGHVQVETKIVERVRYVPVESDDKSSTNDSKEDAPVIKDSAPNFATEDRSQFDRFDFPPLAPKAVTFLTQDVSTKPAGKMLRLRNEVIANGADEALAAADYRQGTFPSTHDGDNSPTMRDLRPSFLRDTDSDVPPRSFLLPGENS